MNKEILKKLQKKADEILADLNERDESGEFEGSHKKHWERKYNDFFVALAELAVAIGVDHDPQDAIEIAELYNTLAGFVYGSVSAYYFDDNGSGPETWEAANGIVICAEECNADYYQAPCHHVCAGSTICDYIHGAIDPREIEPSPYADHQRQRDSVELYRPGWQKDNAKKNLANAIIAWRDGNNFETVETEISEITREHFQSYLSGSGTELETLTEQQAAELAEDYIRLFSTDLFL